MEKLGELLLKNGFLKRKERLDISIEKIENVIKFRFPADYKFYLQGFEPFSGFISAEYVNLWDSETLIKYNTEYGVFSSMTSTIGIGDNGGGELLAIEFIDQNTSRIVITPLIDLNEKFHIEIGASFTDFIFRLTNNKEWF